MSLVLDRKNITEFILFENIFFCIQGFIYRFRNFSDCIIIVWWRIPFPFDDFHFHIVLSKIQRIVRCVHHIIIQINITVDIETNNANTKLSAENN